VEVLTGRTASRPLREVYDYEPEWGLPSAADRAEIVRLLQTAPEGGATPGADASPAVTASGAR